MQDVLHGPNRRGPDEEGFANLDQALAAIAAAERARNEAQGIEHRQQTPFTRPNSRLCTLHAS